MFLLVNFMEVCLIIKKKKKVQPKEENPVRRVFYFLGILYRVGDSFVPIKHKV